MKVENRTDKYQNEKIHPHAELIKAVGVSVNQVWQAI